MGNFWMKFRDLEGKTLDFPNKTVKMLEIGNLSISKKNIKLSSEMPKIGHFLDNLMSNC